MGKTKELVKRCTVSKEQMILYVLFGVVTTLCSLLAWYVTLEIGVLFLHDENGDPTAFLDILGSTAQWVVGVIVAFVTSKKWVFPEAAHGRRAAIRQFGIFCSSRLLTYFLEVAINLGIIYLFEERFLCEATTFSVFGSEVEISARIWAKIASSIFVLITNFLISKLLVFREKCEKQEKE